MLVDLSHPLEPGMPCYPGLPEPKFHVFLAHSDSTGQQKYAFGTTFQIARYELGGNTGTYLDAPFHRHSDGLDLRELPLERMVNLRGALVRADSDGAIGPEVFANLELDGSAVLVYTGWSERWPDAADYFRPGPFLARAACNYLVEQHAALVGIDCANIDDMQDPSRPAHTLLLRAGIPIVENLTNRKYAWDTTISVLCCSSCHCQWHFVRGSGLRHMRVRPEVACELRCAKQARP